MHPMIETKRITMDKIQVYWSNPLGWQHPVRYSCLLKLTLTQIYVVRSSAQFVMNVHPKITSLEKPDRIKINLLFLAPFYGHV